MSEKNEFPQKPHIMLCSVIKGKGVVVVVCLGLLANFCSEISWASVYLWEVVSIAFTSLVLFSLLPLTLQYMYISSFSKEQASSSVVLSCPELTHNNI